MAVGRGKMTEAGNLLVPDVKAGDKILFGKYSGSEVKLEGEEHLILREDDILGVPRIRPPRGPERYETFSVNSEVNTYARKDDPFLPGGTGESFTGG